MPPKKIGSAAAGLKRTSSLAEQGQKDSCKNKKLSASSPAFDEGATVETPGGSTRRSGRERKQNVLLRDMEVGKLKVGRKSSKPAAANSTAGFLSKKSSETQESRTSTDQQKLFSASSNSSGASVSLDTTNSTKMEVSIGVKLQNSEKKSPITEKCTEHTKETEEVVNSNVPNGAVQNSLSREEMNETMQTGQNEKVDFVSCELKAYSPQDVQDLNEVDNPAPSHQNQVVLMDMDTGENRLVGSGPSGSGASFPSESGESNNQLPIAKLPGEETTAKEVEVEGDMMNLFGLFLQGYEQKQSEDSENGNVVELDPAASENPPSTGIEVSSPRKISDASLVESLPKLSAEDGKASQMMLSIDGQVHMVLLPNKPERTQGDGGQTVSIVQLTAEEVEGSKGVNATGNSMQSEGESEDKTAEEARPSLIQSRKITRQEREKEDLLRMSEDGEYCCKMCPYTTAKKVNWYKHKIKHRDRQYSCNVCDYVAKTSSNLKRHLLVHEGVKNFQCNQCQAKFNQKIHLIRHIKYKHENKQVRCAYCDYVGSSIKPDLIAHVRRKHQDVCTIDNQGNISPLNVSGPIETLMKHKCEQCNLYTVSRKDLQQHLKFHKRGGELKFFCEYCSFVTDCKSRLNRHLLTHTQDKPFSCGICDYRANELEHVKRHLKSRHDVRYSPIRRPSKRSKGEDVHDEASSSSPLLEGNFIQKRKYPKTDTRGSEKHFACNFCTMKFTKLLNLFKHVHVQHKQLLPEESLHSCVVCDYSTVCYKRLLTHMRRMHSTANPLNTPQNQVYVCMLCSYSSPYRLYLHAHLKKVHSMQLVSDKEGVNKYMLDASKHSAMLVQESEESNAKKPGSIIKRIPGMESEVEKPPKDSKMVLVQLTSDGPMTPVYISTGNEEAATSSLLSGDNDYPIMETGIMDGTPLCLEACEDHDLGQVLMEVSSSVPPTCSGAVLANTSTENITVEAEQASSEEDNEEEEEEMEAEEEEEEAAKEEEPAEVKSEQVVHLSSGDFVEINGQIYKIEMESNGESKEEARNNEKSEENEEDNGKS